MIRVVLAPEPSDFDRKVRQLGNSAMRHLAGQAVRGSGARHGSSWMVRTIPISDVEVPHEPLPALSYAAEVGRLLGRPVEQLSEPPERLVACTDVHPLAQAASGTRNCRSSYNPNAGASASHRGSSAGHWPTFANSAQPSRSSLR